MKKRIERARQFYNMALQNLELMSEELNNIEGEYEGIVRRVNPPPISHKEGSGGPRKYKTDAELGKAVRKYRSKSNTKRVREQTDGQIIRAIKSSTAYRQNPVQITPGMIIARREQQSLKRGVHAEQQITQQELSQSWE